MKDKLGFTLAEVLISVVVIGIVTALTVPALYNNHQKKTQLMLLQKAYKDLTENMTMLSSQSYKGFYSSPLSLNSKTVVADDGSATLTRKTVDQTAGEFFRKYYDLSKECKETAQPCFAANYKKLSNGDLSSFSCADGYSVILKSGTAMCIIPADKKHDGDGTEANPASDAHPATVYIDVNGPDKPNTGGRDMFVVNIYNDYSVDDIKPADAKSSTSRTVRNELAANCLTSAVGEGCFSKIINANWRMNY